jgi:hypothetical protein
MFIFATFGDSNIYRNAINMIINEANSMNIFDKIFAYDETKLDSRFLEKNKEFINQNRRGYGYWIWKPQVIKQTFECMNDGDTLLYADSGCRLNIQGIKRLLEYKEKTEASEHKNLSFPLSYYFKGYKSSHLEKIWTKGDVYNIFDMTGKEEAQLVGGIFLMTKCEKTVNMINKWLEICEKYTTIDDSPSKKPNCEGFQEHRHDQSVWSVVRKHYGTEILESDETYHLDFGANLDKPIHAIRRK